MRRFVFAVSVLMFFCCDAAVITAPAQGFTTLHSFAGPPTEGSSPNELIQASDGNFYGTTSRGGINCVDGCGTVFEITANGTLTTLYNFCSLNNCADGDAPQAGLIQAADGNFYGTTAGGGTHTCFGYTCGTVFKITPNGTLTTLYSFCSEQGCTDGAFPMGRLIQADDGNFYGTTSGGGSNNCTGGCGTIFKVTPSGTLTTLYAFCSQINGFCLDGASPMSSLIQASDGNFYGTTLAGGTGNFGTLYKITSAGTLTTLHSFNFTDGADPRAALIQATDGKFYGTTTAGGTYGGGTAFKVSSTGTLTTLHSFCSQMNCVDGADPQAGLVQAHDGNFLGTTNGPFSFCRSHDCGTVFEITSTSMFTTLYQFCAQTNCVDGAAPTAGLIQTANGNFYGTTSTGGTANFGTVFTFGPATVRLQPPSLSFAPQALDETSLPKTVTLTNSGTALLTISNVSISGDFAISSNTCTGAALIMGKNCKVMVTFTPTALGMRAGTLTFTDNAGNSPQTVPLTGTGIAQATLTPANATWAPQTVGTRSAPKTFTLTNNQALVLTNIAISTTGDFSVSATTCTTSLAAKARCTISVVFAPTQMGTRRGQLVVNDSANNSPQISNLTGTGR